MPTSISDLFANLPSWFTELSATPGLSEPRYGKAFRLDPEKGEESDDAIAPRIAARNTRRVIWNPLLDYKTQEAESSIFKTFSGQQSPTTPLKRQQEQLQPVDALNGWLFQEGRGVASWKFDAAVGSHAYDRGSGSNDDQSGDRDPFYPAIELLSMAGLTCFHVFVLRNTTDATIYHETPRDENAPRTRFGWDYRRACWRSGVSIRKSGRFESW